MYFRNTIYFLLFSLLPFTKMVAQKTDKQHIDFEKELPPLEILSKSKSVNVITKCDYEWIMETAKKEGRKITYNAPIGSETEPQVMVPGYKHDKNAKDSIQVIFSALEYFKGAMAEYAYLPLKAKLLVTDDKGVVLFKGEVPFDGVRIDFTQGKILDGKQASVTKMEVLAKNKTISSLNDFLRQNYGFNNTFYKLPYFDVKDKKKNYPEYHLAIEKTIAAYAATKNNTDEFEKNLKEAIGIWETALKELDKTNKDARINKDVGAATYLNLAISYTWLNEFEKANQALTDYKALDEDYSVAASKIKSILDDYYKRYTLFNK